MIALPAPTVVQPGPGKSCLIQGVGRFARPLEGRKLLSFWWFRPNLGANPRYQDEWTVAYRLVYAAVALGALAGLVLSLSNDGWRRWALIYAVLGIETLVYLGFHVLTRFRWEIEFILLILASSFLAWACRKAVLRMEPTDPLAHSGGV